MATLFPLIRPARIAPLHPGRARFIRTPRLTAWEAWTTASLLEQWWVPAPTTARIDRLDVRPGGAFVTRMSDDGQTRDRAARRSEARNLHEELGFADGAPDTDAAAGAKPWIIEE